VAIREDGVSAVLVGELLDQNLRIPHYQRPYSWEPATALQLFDDIKDTMNDDECGDVPYVLGTVILHEDGDRLDVVDGQQRLLTLLMILRRLNGPDDFPRGVYAENPVARVRNALDRRIDALPENERGRLTPFIRQHCELIRVVTDDADEAFRVFDSQNYRGKPLAPHDLLKAHHLREMRDETAAMKQAVVEAWESVEDDDLTGCSRPTSIALRAGLVERAHRVLPPTTSGCSRGSRQGAAGHRVLATTSRRRQRFPY
jgi:hypothetical protein